MISPNYQINNQVTRLTGRVRFAHAISNKAFLTSSGLAKREIGLVWKIPTLPLFSLLAKLAINS